MLTQSMQLLQTLYSVTFIRQVCGILPAACSMALPRPHESFSDIPGLLNAIPFVHPTLPYELSTVFPAGTLLLGGP